MLAGRIFRIAFGIEKLIFIEVKYLFRLQTEDFGDGLEAAMGYIRFAAFDLP